MSAVVECPTCGRTEWHRERGPDCMYAVCRCGFGYDISGSLVHPQAVIVSLDEGWEP